MIRTVFALAVAALTMAAFSGLSQAAPIAPLPGHVAGAGNVTQVHWHRWHHWHHWHGCRWHRCW